MRFLPFPILPTPKDFSICQNPAHRFSRVERPLKKALKYERTLPQSQGSPPIHRMPPLLFPGSSGLFFKRSALFSLCFQQDTFHTPRLPSLLHFSIIDNPHLHHVSVNQQLRMTMHGDSPEPPPHQPKVFGEGWGRVREKKKRPFPKGPSLPSPSLLPPHLPLRENTMFFHS